MDLFFEIAASIAGSTHHANNPGTFGFLLNNLKFVESTQSFAMDLNRKKIIQFTFNNFILSGTGLALLFCLIFFVASIFFAYLFCRKWNNSCHSNAKHMARSNSFNKISRYSIKNDHNLKSWLCLGATTIIPTLFLFISIVGMIGSLSSILMSTKLVKTEIILPSENLTDSIGQMNKFTKIPCNSFLIDSNIFKSTSQEYVCFTVLAPARLVEGLNLIQKWLINFENRTVSSTLPVVMDMISETEAMQVKSSKIFQLALQEKIGSIETQKLGKQMTKFLVTLINNTDYLSGKASKYTQNSFDQMYIDWPEFVDGISTFSKNKSELDHLIPKEEIDEFFKSLDFLIDVKYDENIIDNAYVYPVAKSVQLLLVLGEGKTVDRVLSDSRYSEIKLKAKNKITAQRSHERMKIAETLKNSSRENFERLGKKTYGAAEKIEFLKPKLFAKSDRIVRLVLILVVFLAVTISLLIFIICIFRVFFAINFGNDANKQFNSGFGKFFKHLSVSNKVYAFFLISSAILLLLIACILFSFHSIIETQVCRNLRISTYSTGKYMPMDKLIDTFLDANWDNIKKMAASKTPPGEPPSPLPRVKHVLQGLALNCRKPGIGIIEALNGQINPADMANPKVSERFMRIGRELMHDSIMETDPKEMMPPGQLESLEKADSLNMFFVNYKEILEATKNIFYFKNREANVSLSDMKKHLDNLLKVLNSSTYIEKYTNIVKVYKSITNVSSVHDRVIYHLQELTKLEPVLPLVQELRIKLPMLIDTMSNKKKFKQIGDDLYEILVVNKSKENSEKLMSKHGANLMYKLGGDCHELNLAYDQLISLFCDDILITIGGLWFFLGFGWFCVIWSIVVLAIFLPGWSISTISHPDSMKTCSVNEVDECYQLKSTDEKAIDS